MTRCIPALFLGVPVAGRAPAQSNYHSIAVATLDVIVLARSR